MVNYSLLIIGLLFCVIILVELIFNFTGLLKENYKQYQKNNKEYFTGEETTTTAEPTISYTLTRKASPDVYNNDDEGDDYYNKSIKQVTFMNNSNFISNCVTFENSEPIRADWFKRPESSSSTISADNKLEQLNLSDDVVCAITSIECQLTKGKDNCTHCTPSNN